MDVIKGNPQRTSRKTAKIVGVLYIIGTISGILSLVFSDSIRSAENLLSAVTANEIQVIIGALFILTMGLALAMVPVMMFPILKKQNEALALGYVVFRGGLEAVTYILITIGWLLLLPLSQEYAQAGAPDVNVLDFLGTQLFEVEAVGYIGTIVFCLGALMFYSLLYQSRLVPRWLSGWGLIALIPFFAAPFLSMFAAIEPLSTAAIVLDLPLALQEMVLAVWLIAKGFNANATDSQKSKNV
jgi:hypothetical protein